MASSVQSHLETQSAADGQRRVSIADVDPGLVVGLDEQQADLARRYAGVVVHTLRPGPWNPAELLESSGGGLGMIVVDGLVCHQIRLGSAVGLEVLGAEDIVRPRSLIPSGLDGEADGGEEWSVLRPARIAVIDDVFSQVAARIPGLGQALLERSLERSQRLALHLAISALPRVEDRLLAILSLFAERWGRVAPGGVKLTLPLTHQMLGLLIGARRPTVTLAITALRERGVLHRTPEGAWLLPPSGAEVVSLDGGRPSGDVALAG